jgi:glycosyltransferase involved in cell wall biosynthesis
MRIFHINCNYIGTTLHQLMIENLDILGYDNQVFVPTYDKNLAVIEPNANVFVCECFRKWDRLFFDCKQKKIRNGIETNIDIPCFDLIHAYTLFTDGNCARKLAKKFAIPYVVAVRNTDVNDFFRLMPHLHIRGVQIMRDASAVFFLSEAYRKQVFEKYIPKAYWAEIRKKTFIIPNGIDEFWFENTPIKDKVINKKAVKLVYVGRIDKNKNIPTTQKAMAILRKQGYETTLLVVGKVQDEKEFRIIKKDFFTKCYPEMPKDKLLDIYRDSDIFVMPSFTESFGLVYAEAMSQGIPVIYAKGQGFDEQFDEGVVGYHVVVDCPNEVAAGIKRVIDNYYDIQKNVVSSAREFSWAKIVRKYDQIYKKVVSK